LPRRPPAGAPSAGSEQAVWDALGQFFRSRQPWLQRASEASGVPPPQLWVLVYLTEFGPTSAGELSQYLGVTPAAVTFVIHELRRNRCVELRRGEDRRRVMVRLLPSGRRRIRRLLLWRQDLGHEVLGSFTAAEREAFARLLRKFSAAVDALAPMTVPGSQGAGSNRRVRKPPRARVHRDSSA
jgi:DNA-binding MarR family transcriptional regulator